MFWFSNLINLRNSSQSSHISAIGQGAFRIDPAPKLRRELWKCTPRKPQFYAVGSILYYCAVLRQKISPGPNLLPPRRRERGAKAFTSHLYVFSGRALFYLAISRNRGHKSRIVLIKVFPYRWQGTMNFPFLVRVRQLHFSTPTSCRSHAGMPQNFKTHAEDLRRTLN